MNKSFFTICVVFTLGGCAGNQSENMMLGNDISYASLQEQREASLSVKEYESLPENAESRGPVETSRCHRDTSSREPSKDVLLLDLKIAAWARGADAIANVQYSKESALMKNCWYMLNATADSFRLEK